MKTFFFNYGFGSEFESPYVHEEFIICTTVSIAKNLVTKSPDKINIRVSVTST